MTFSIAGAPLVDSCERQDLGPLLDRLRDGDPAAFDELFPMVYEEFRRLARRQRKHWEGNETLNTTALLHEAYLKLAGQAPHDWQDRAHFLHSAAKVMRHILINYAERRSAKKRGAGGTPVSLDRVASVLRDPDARTGHELDALIELDGALARLSAEDARNGMIVECRVFGGMTIRETAEALNVSEATVSRGWAAAQAWLRRELLEGVG